MIDAWVGLTIVCTCLMSFRNLPLAKVLEGQPSRSLDLSLSVCISLSLSLADVGRLLFQSVHEGVGHLLSLDAEQKRLWFASQVEAEELDGLAVSRRSKGWLHGHVLCGKMISKALFPRGSEIADLQAQRFHSHQHASKDGAWRPPWHA